MNAKSLTLILALLNYETVSCSIDPVIIIHGGAGTISNVSAEGMLRGVSIAATIGYEILMQTDNAMEAVEEAVRYMELNEFFNAGYGSVLTSEGNVEMDASIMDGSNLKVGCVTGVIDIVHPISVAKRVMEKTPHNFLSGEGVMRFAKEQGFKILHPGTLVSQKSLNAWERWKETQEQIGGLGTVGAVAIDSRGNIAAATSTGGITGKLPGRVGDTPIIGSGTYADNDFGGVSSTGHGESIMKSVLTHDIIKRMEYLKEDIQTASENACNTMTKRFNQTGGVIALDKSGKVGIAFTSRNMAWAYKNKYEIKFSINHFNKTMKINKYGKFEN